jgi:hypothetical protein
MMRNSILTTTTKNTTPHRKLHDERVVFLVVVVRIELLII